jgi:DNA polymerase V
MSVKLDTPTAATPELLTAALALTKKLFREGVPYRKAGCLLADLRPAAATQRTLFDDQQARKRSSALMATLDKINQSCGSGTIQFGAEGFGKREWQAKSDNLSPHYTTRWDELPEARTG